MARLLSVVLLALVAAGCAGSGGRLTKDEYVTRLRALESSDLVRHATDLYTNMAAFVLPQEECVSKVRSFHSDLQDIVDLVHALRPPAEVQQIQDDFVDAGQETVDTIGRIQKEIEDGTLKCGEAFNRRAYGLSSTKRAQRAIDELGRKGYLIGLNAAD